MGVIVFFKTIKAYVYVLLSWRSIITFGLAVAGIILFYSISWMPVQLFWVKTMAKVFNLVGHSSNYINNVLIVDGFVIRFSPLCTYMLVILIDLPFIWRKDCILRNMMRILLFMIMVFFLNIARIFFVIIWYLNGIPWKYSHTLFSHSISWLIFILIFMFWLRAIKKNSYRIEEQIG